MKTGEHRPATWLATQGLVEVVLINRVEMSGEPFWAPLEVGGMRAIPDAFAGAEEEFLQTNLLLTDKNSGYAAAIDLGAIVACDSLMSLPSVPEGVAYLLKRMTGDAHAGSWPVVRRLALDDHTVFDVEVRRLRQQCQTTPPE